MIGFSGMKNIFKTSALAFVVSAFMASANGAQAEPLKAALAKAYTSNPTLEAQRKELESNLYLIPEAQSNFRPSLGVSGSADWRRTDNEIANPVPSTVSKTDLSTQEMAVSLTQPLYRGGRTRAEVNEARNLVMSNIALLTQTEQDVLLDAVTAYFNLEQARATLRLRKKNEAVLDEQLQATNDRFNVGELTKTDVSQAESRLAESKANRIAAEGDVEQAIAVYEQIIGEFDKSQEKMLNDIALMLPTSIGEAVDAGLKNHPLIAQTVYNQRVAVDGREQVEGELLPELNLVGSASKTYDPSTFVDESDQMAIGFSLSMPLYEGGAIRSRINRADRVASQRQIQIAEAERLVRQNVINAWNEYQSSKAQIEAINTQIKSAEVALEGVREEASVGTRTVLDILDAEEELVNAQVSLVIAQKDVAISQFQLLQSMGSLNAKTLELDVPYYSYVALMEDLDNNWMLFE